MNPQSLTLTIEQLFLLELKCWVTGLVVTLPYILKSTIRVWFPAVMLDTEKQVDQVNQSVRKDGRCAFNWKHFWITNTQ